MQIRVLQVIFKKGSLSYNEVPAGGIQYESSDTLTLRGRFTPQPGRCFLSALTTSHPPTPASCSLVSVKPSSTLWGFWAWKPVRVPHSLFVGNRLQPPCPSLSPKGQIHRTGANQGREGMQRQGRRSQETMVQPWDRVLVPPQGIHRTVSLSSL